MYGYFASLCVLNRSTWLRVSHAVLTKIPGSANVKQRSRPILLRLMQQMSRYVMTKRCAANFTTLSWNLRCVSLLVTSVVCLHQYVASVSAPQSHGCLESSWHLASVSPQPKFAMPRSHASVHWPRFETPHMHYSICRMLAAAASPSEMTDIHQNIFLCYAQVSLCQVVTRIKVLLFMTVLLLP